jgi:hypothetical protein
MKSAETRWSYCIGKCKHDGSSVKSNEGHVTKRKWHAARTVSLCIDGTESKSLWYLFQKNISLGTYTEQSVMESGEWLHRLSSIMLKKKKQSWYRGFSSPCCLFLPHSQIHTDNTGLTSNGLQHKNREGFHNSLGYHWKSALYVFFYIIYKKNGPFWECTRKTWNDFTCAVSNSIIHN